MEEYEKQYPMGDDGMYDMYYYDDKMPPEDDEAIVDDDGFDSDEALFFDNNDLANRIWEGEDNDW